ncbi:hypothetical protein BBBOND_0401640 [Babesia bigemina]|uniref:Uncharacterized protein n=1 Tax=Babesia bigemina TaxID=5866 RepID=A0A061DC96_BABBI|nr:hypothetical protein BBBOND_0401640 [Babesia bigemina]CDR97672.1 hypothetical protein BBBOND_0401640 [Babesia bigemina]|eukprot:XP_012769858.1 hypothetical protein BBBOND_0401640 [Babesia bigemina]
MCNDSITASENDFTPQQYKCKIKPQIDNLLYIVLKVSVSSRCRLFLLQLLKPFPSIHVSAQRIIIKIN